MLTDVLTNELYLRAIDAGMSVALFWESSAMEIVDFIESADRQKVESKKGEVAGWVHQARLIGENNPMTQVNHYTMPWDIYPELFADEKAEHDKMQFDNAMAKRRAAAAQWNDKRNK